MAQSAYESFAENNDNLGLFGIGIFEKVRNYVEETAIAAEAGTPICFRVRWSATEQKSGGRDIGKALGAGACVPTLEIQYVVDNVHTYNHVGALSPFDEALDLGDEELLSLDRLASTYDTELTILG